MLPSNPGFYNQLYTPGNSSDGLVLKAGSLLSTEAQEEKKIHHGEDYRKLF